MSEAMTKEIVYQAGDGSEVKLTHDLIRTTLCSGNAECTPKEVFLYAKLCQARRLNPFVGDAFLVKYGKQDAQILTSKSYWMRKLKQHPGYENHRAGILVATQTSQESDGYKIDKHTGTFYMEGRQELVGGWAEVTINGYTHYHDVALKNYHKGQATWNAMPATMIRKVALAQLIREILPNVFSGMYMEGEVGMRDVSPNENAELLELRKEIASFGNKKWTEAACGMTSVVALAALLDEIKKEAADAK